MRRQTDRRLSRCVLRGADPSSSPSDDLHCLGDQRASVSSDTRTTAAPARGWGKADELVPPPLPGPVPTARPRTRSPVLLDARTVREQESRGGGGRHGPMCAATAVASPLTTKPGLGPVQAPAAGAAPAQQFPVTRHHPFLEGVGSSPGWAAWMCPALRSSKALIEHLLCAGPSDGRVQLGQQKGMRSGVRPAPSETPAKRSPSLVPMAGRNLSEKKKPSGDPGPLPTCVSSKRPQPCSSWTACRRGGLAPRAQYAPGDRGRCWGTGRPPTAQPGTKVVG